MTIDKIKDDLIYLIHCSDGEISGVGSNSFDPMPQTNVLDYEHKMHAARKALKKTNRIYDRFKHVSKENQKILCAWVASQQLNAQLTYAFGELAWIAVYLFQDIEKLTKICSMQQLSPNPTTSKIIQTLKINARAKLTIALKEYVNDN